MFEGEVLKYGYEVSGCWGGRENKLGNVLFQQSINPILHGSFVHASPMPRTTAGFLILGCTGHYDVTHNAFIHIYKDKGRLIDTHRSRLPGRTTSENIFPRCLDCYMTLRQTPHDRSDAL